MAIDRGDYQGAADLVERYLRHLPMTNCTERAAALELLVRAETKRDGSHDLDRARTALKELHSIAARADTVPLLASASLAAGLIALAKAMPIAHAANSKMPSTASTRAERPSRRPARASIWRRPWNGSVVTTPHSANSNARSPN
jgi:ATP/maltotriose-dependent transcriptional regulator MalT